jgi:hypothetical protein
MTRARSAGRRGWNLTGLVLCLAMATNACAGAIPPSATAPGTHGAIGVTEGQAPAPAASTPAPAPSAPSAAAAAAASVAASLPTEEPTTLPPAETPKEEPMPEPPRGYDKALEGSSIPADPHRTRRIWGYAGIAIGGAALVGAVVSSFMLLHQKSVVNDNCNGVNQCNATGLAETGTINQTVPFNDATWIVAAVGLIGGGILLLTSQPDSDDASHKSTALTVAPAPGGASLGLRSTF